MHNRWNISPASESESAESAALAQELRVSPVVGTLLAKRGIYTIEEADAFFKPQLADLHNPFLMKDMDKAVERLNRAIGRKERILIYGDYDVDGTTAVALVYKSLRAMGCSGKLLDYYIPDRYDEGYGISYQGIDYAGKWGASLIIVLDCGIKAIEKVDYASHMGIDFIICDHHNPDDELPHAVAVLDAKRPDNTYPYEHLSGCGVGFKFMQAFAINNGYPAEELYRFLDLLAVSIAADIVPVTGENRILAYHGLKRLNRNPSLGLRSIIRSTGLEGKQIDMGDIVFKIGPRINASGRMMNGREAVDLLLARDSETALRCNASISAYNDQRRELDKSTTNEALGMINAHPELAERSIILLYNPNWHKGVIGIVASRLSERFNRPTIILTKSGEYVSGSARSACNFDVYKAIESCRDLLVNFGGHTYAAGVTLNEEDIETFAERMRTHAEQAIAPERLNPTIDVDSVIELKAVTPKLLRDLKRMGPFGPGNEKPVFAAHNLYDRGSAKTVGKGLEHLKLDLTDSRGTMPPMHAIAFKQADSNKVIRPGQPFSACFTVEENHFMGQTGLQLMVLDIREND